MYAATLEGSMTTPAEPDLATGWFTLPGWTRAHTKAASRGDADE